MKIVASTEDDIQIKVCINRCLFSVLLLSLGGLGADGILLRPLKTSYAVPVYYPCVFFCFLFFRFRADARREGKRTTLT